MDAQGRGNAPSAATAAPDALAIARDLIRCPSVTPADAGALDVLQSLLAAHGFDTQRVPFGAGDAAVDNLYARLGTAPPFLLFAGHTDVVPPGERWRHDPFAATVEGGVLFGRGAQDMKGGIAAFVAAVLAHLAAHGAPRGSIGFLVTGDEEGPAVNGTARLLDWVRDRGERFDHCIVGEPTSRARVGDTLKVGRRGSLNGRLLSRGRQGHVAYPAKAANPIPPLLAALAALRVPLDAGTARFDPSNLEITTVDTGNAATNVIPAQARAAFNVRFNDRWDADTLAAELRARVAAAVPPGTVALELLPSNAPAFHTEASPFTDLVAAAVAAVTGAPPALSTSGGTSDARFIQRDGPVVELGLVGDTMHMVDERVPLADLDRLAAIYREIVARYFA